MRVARFFGIVTSFINTCDTTHAWVRKVRTCGMTHACMGQQAHSTESCIRRDSSVSVLCAIWLVHVCDSTHACVSHVCDLTHACVSHVCDLTHACVSHVCDLTHACVSHVCDLTHACVSQSSIVSATKLMHVRRECGMSATPMSAGQRERVRDRDTERDIKRTRQRLRNSKSRARKTERERERESEANRF